MHGIYISLHKTDEADAKWFHDNAFYPTPLPFLSLKTVASLSCFASNETPLIWHYDALYSLHKKKLRSGWRKPFLEEKENFMIHFYICGSSRGGGVYDKTLYRIAIFAFHCTLIQLSSSFYYFITFVENFRAFFIHEKVDILKV